MDDVTQALVALTTDGVWVRFTSVEAVMAMMACWPVALHVVGVLRRFPERRGKWDAALTLRDDTMPWLREHPRRRRPVIRALRALIEAPYERAALLTDGHRLSIMPLIAPIPTALPAHHVPVLNGSVLAAE